MASVPIYKWIAINGGGSGGGVPMTPVNFLAIPSNGTVDLTWSASPGATSYTVSRASTPGGTRTEFTVGTNSYNASVTNGTTYYWSVAAVNGSGSSARTYEQECTPRVTYYIATTGNDTTGSGTIGSPWQTVDKARSYINTTYSGGGANLPTGGVTVMMRGGYYRQTATLTLNIPGASGKLIEWRSYPGEFARIGGGKPITSWSAVTGADSRWSQINAPATLYKASLNLSSYGTGHFGNYDNPAIAEISFDGSVMQLGMYPKPGTDWPAISGTGVTWNGFPTTTRTFTQSADPPRSWTGALAESNLFNRPYIHVQLNSWRDDFFIMSGRNDSANTFTTICQDRTEYGWDCIDASCYQVINLLEEVYDPGEYWIDRVTGDCYFRPPDDVNPSTSGKEVLVSELSTVMTISASYQKFRDISIESSQETLANVISSNINFTGCTIRNSAEIGLHFSAGDSLITGCNFSGFGRIAINCAYTANNLTIDDNSFTASARYENNAGPSIMFEEQNTGANISSGHLVTHNLFTQMNHEGIFCSSSNTTIEYNEFEYTLKNGGDAGSIYCHWNGATSNNVIRYNYFHDVVRAGGALSNGSARIAIYLDQDDGQGTDTAGFSVYGNIIHRYGDGTLPDTGGMRGEAILNKHANGTSNSFQNNLMARVDVPAAIGSHGSFTEITNNQSWTSQVNLPTGNNNGTNPNFTNEAAGDLSNNADGGTYLYNSYRIPFNLIGRRVPT